jgi:hypothetical protein
MYKFELQTEELSDIKTLANASDIKVRLILLVEVLENYLRSITCGDLGGYHHCAYLELKQQAHQSRCLLDHIS